MPFTHFPNEIIADVIAAACEDPTKIGINLRKLIQIKGNWAEFARQRGQTILLKYYLTDGSPFTICCAEEGSTLAVSLEEAKTHRIRYSDIYCSLNFQQLMAIAPNLYEKVRFLDFPDRYCDALELMATRFSSLVLSSPCGELAPLQIVNFIARQLNSKYLRELILTGFKFEIGEFDEQLIEFVRRRWFENLTINGQLVSFRVFKEAHKAFISRNFFEVRKQQINARISHEDVKAMKDYFKKHDGYLKKGDRSSNARILLQHPSVHTAQMDLEIDEFRFVEADFIGLQG